MKLRFHETSHCNWFPWLFCNELRCYRSYKRTRLSFLSLWRLGLSQLPHKTHLMAFLSVDLNGSVTTTTLPERKAHIIFIIIITEPQAGKLG